MVPNKNKNFGDSKTGSCRKSKPAYKSRLCGRHHALRVYWKFLDMNWSQRRAAVKKQWYCPNCLTHEHSSPTCTCNYCSANHHSMVHRPGVFKRKNSGDKNGNSANRRNQSTAQQRLDVVRIQSSAISTTAPNASTPTLKAMLSANTVNLLPTVLHRIVQAKKIVTARA